MDVVHEDTFVIGSREAFVAKEDDSATPGVLDFFRMLHRHLTHQGFTPAAIDDLIARGQRADWERLRSELLANPSLFETVRQVCLPNVKNPHAQRYHFWLRYAEERRT